jgi:hypothetical protein
MRYHLGYLADLSKVLRDVSFDTELGLPDQ